MINISTVLGLNQSLYNFKERRAFYGLRLRLLSSASTLILGKPRLRLRGIPETASGQNKINIQANCMYCDIVNCHATLYLFHSE